MLEALRALFAFRGVEFEREPFREAVRPWLESENYQIRQSAVWALSTLSPSSADLPALAARARDPKRSVRAEVLPALANTAGAFEDPAVLAIATGLLREAIPENKYRMLRPLRRFDLPPELQLAVIEVRQSGGIARKIAHRTLVYLPTKSEATVLFLVDGIGEFRSNRHTFALQGLQHGVPRHLHSLVAANLVNALHRWPVGTTPHWSLQGLGEIGTEAHLETIREWGRARPNTAYEREAREAVAKIEARLAAVEE